MTDRVVSLTVILDQEYRVDDVERIVDAITMVRGVAEVKLGPVANVDTYWAINKNRNDLLPKIIKLFHPD